MNLGLLLPSGVRLSRLGLGTAGLHLMPDARGRTALLELALAEGVTHFDTAPYYGFGFAEAELGRVLAGESQATIATKVGLGPPRMMSSRRGEVLVRKALGRLVPGLVRPRIDWRIAELATSLVRSLARLRRSRVDLLLLHEPGRGVLASEPISVWLEELVREGIVGAWGMAGELDDTLAQARRFEPLPPVLQLRDSPAGTAASAMAAIDRRPQLTYGYFSRREAATSGDPRAAALTANPQGTVLFASRQAERIASFAALSRHG